jgi:hypothetical protein
MDNGIDAFVNRKSDNQTLAIEHTIIEPFVGEKEDFALFEATLLAIEKDQSLAVPGRWIRVFIPVGTLVNRPKKEAQSAIAQSIHAWINSNRLLLAYGASQHLCRIVGIPGQVSFDIVLNIKVVPLKSGTAAQFGVINVSRQQMESNLGDVVDKALRKKLPKLAAAVADKRILLLERQHMNLHPQSILDEIESRKGSFPELAKVDEIWFVETPFYGTPFGGTYLRFERYENGDEIASLDFREGELFMRFENGYGEVISDISDD